MSNSNKPIKIAYVQKLTNWAMLHGVHLKEIAKTSTIFSWKQQNPWFFEEDKRATWKKNTAWWEYIYFKALVNRFQLTPKLMRVSQRTKLFIANLLPNGLPEKVKFVSMSNI